MKIISSVVLIPMLLANFAWGQEELNEHHPRFRMGAEWALWDRTSSLGASFGIPINDRFFILVGSGRQTYHNIDSYFLGSRMKQYIDLQWIDLLLRYDHPLSKDFSLGLTGGLERLKGHVTYTFHAFSDVEITDKQDLETYALVAKPTIYFTSPLFRKVPLQIGLGVYVRILRETTYSINYSDGSIHDETFPVGIMTSGLAVIDLLF